MGPKTMNSMIFQKGIGSDMFYWIRHCVGEMHALLSALLVIILMNEKKTPVLTNVGVLLLFFFLAFSMVWST